ncbi:uncharacterized protein [Montipora capricornis]|uniref:uncharacterized protein isoform X2 n=1 Tax=Montipora foliosa TaxID=591990 RepID=UPI0035F17B24
MGQGLGRYQSERREKAVAKRRLVDHLMELGHHIERIAAARQNLENELRAQDPSHPLEAKPENLIKICLPSGPVDLQEETESLMREISEQKTQLQLLKEKDEFQRKNSRDESMLAALEERLKDLQDHRLTKADQVDIHTVYSFPNLHTTKFPMRVKRRKT